MTLEQAKFEFSQFVNGSCPDASFWEIYQAFVAEKMKLDKYFSDFLEENEDEMGKDNTYDGKSWKTYKSQLKEYNDIDDSIRRVKYYLNKNVR